MKKKVLCLAVVLMAALLCAMFLTASATTYSGSCGTGLSWSLSTDTGVLSITGSGEMSEFMFDYAPWYSYRNFITSVTIGNSVTTIGWQVFYNCTGLTSVTIPDSVTSIGNYAFYGCTGIISVTIGDGVTSIGKSAFRGCSSLEEITLSMITYLNYYFGASDYSSTGCIPSSLKKVTVLGTQIPRYAFYNCAGLTSVIIPDSVTSIGKSAFTGCTGLISITIPDSVTSIGDYAFSGCSGLTAVTIPDSVKSIGYGAFSGCTELVSAQVLNSKMAFPESAGVFPPNTIIIAEENSTAQEYAARYQYTFVSIIVNGTCGTLLHWSLNTFTGVFSVTGTGKMKNYGAVEAPWNECRPLIRTITISEGVTQIGTYAFSGCTNLTSVTLPESLTGIGGGAFENCGSLTSVTLPRYLSTLGGNAFLNCNSLETMVVKNDSMVFGNTSVPFFTMLYGNVGSSAQAYAKLNGNDFEQIVTPGVWSQTKDNALRIIATIDSVNYSSVGFLFTKNGVSVDPAKLTDAQWQCLMTGESKLYRTTVDGQTYFKVEIITVFQALSAGGNVITAQSLGGRYLYTFSIVNITGDARYNDYCVLPYAVGDTVQYGEEKTVTLTPHNITFRVEEQTVDTQRFAENEVVTFDGDTPTKPKEGNYCYSFNGWADQNGTLYRAKSTELFLVDANDQITDTPLRAGRNLTLTAVFITWDGDDSWGKLN